MKSNKIILSSCGELPFDLVHDQSVDFLAERESKVATDSVEEEYVEKRRLNLLWKVVWL